MFSPKLISPSEHREWWQELRDNPRKRAFIYQSNDELLGFVKLERVTDNLIEWGFYKAPSAKKGIGFEMGKAVIDGIFRGSEIQSIMGKVIPTNTRSIQLHERLGFERMQVDSEAFKSYSNPNNPDQICFLLERDRWRAKTLPKD